jgi:hypothetical protein
MAAVDWGGIIHVTGRLLRWWRVSKSSKTLVAGRREVP